MAILASNTVTQDSAFEIYAGFAVFCGFTFNLAADALVTSIKIPLGKFGNPPNNYTVAIYPATGTPGIDAIGSGSPIAVSANILASTLPSTPSLQTISFSNVVLSAGKYAVVARYNDGAFGNNVEIGMSATSASSLYNMTTYNSSSSTWSYFSNNQQMTFEVNGSYLSINGKDITGSAYISAPSIAMPVQGIVGGWSTSAVGGQAAGEVLRPQYITTDRTQTGNARISQVVLALQSGSAYITGVVSRNQTGNARITATTIRTQVGNARIGLVTTRTQIGSATIASSFTTTDRTQTGNANIRNDTSHTQIGNARITNTSSHSQVGNARITQIVSASQIGNARITATTTKTQVGNARITQIVYRTQTGNARIQLVTDRAQTGRALIAQEYLRTQPGNARITKGIDYTQKPSLNVENIKPSLNATIEKGSLTINERKATIFAGSDKPTLTVVNDKDMRLNIK